MDEKEYRSAYQNLNPIRCVFEKAINSRICNCSQSTRFNLADREGVSCNSASGQQQCTQVLATLRENAKFVLQQKSIDGQLPHNSEIKIQNGGVKGIVKVLKDTSTNENDIYNVLNAASKEFTSIDLLPFNNIIQEISSYQGRRKNKREK